MTHDTPPDLRSAEQDRGPTSGEAAGFAHGGSTSPCEPGIPREPVGRLAQLRAAVPARTWRIALYVLPLVALANVAVLVWSLGGVDLSRAVVAGELVALAALLAFVPMLANAARLAIWGRFLGLCLGFRGALKVITGTMVANSVTPSATGGMPIKLLFLVGAGVESRRAVTLISLQAAEDALVMAALALVCFGVSGFAMVDFLASDAALLERIGMTVRTAGIALVSALAAIALAAVAVAGGLFGRRAQGWATEAIRRARAFLAQVVGDWAAVWRRGKASALANLALALLQWTVRFSIAGLVLAAFGVEWQPALYWLAQYLVQAVSSIVPTPGGAGGAEAAFLLVFAPFVPVEALLPAMSAWRLLHFFLPLGGAALLFALLHRADPGRRTAAAAPRDAQPAE